MSKNKKRNRAIRAKCEEDIQKKDFPDRCFCDEPDCTYDENSYIGESDFFVYDKFDYNQINPITLSLYMCNKCGKKTNLLIAK